MKGEVDIQSTEMFVIQVSGERMRVYKRTISGEDGSFKRLTDFLDPKTNPREIKEIFKVIQTQDSTEISNVSTQQASTAQTSTPGQLKRKLQEVELK